MLNLNQILKLPTHPTFKGKNQKIEIDGAFEAQGKNIPRPRLNKYAKMPGRRLPFHTGAQADGKPQRRFPALLFNIIGHARFRIRVPTKKPGFAQITKAGEQLPAFIGNISFYRMWQVGIGRPGSSRTEFGGPAQVILLYQGAPDIVPTKGPQLQTCCNRTRVIQAGAETGFGNKPDIALFGKLDKPVRAGCNA